MKSLNRIVRAAMFAALFVTALFIATPVRAQFVMGNMAGGPGNIVASSSGYATINTNFYASYLTGTAYTETAAVAAVTGGTTSPSVTLGSPGTYFVYGDLDVNYVGATFAANQTVTCEVFRTNNTPAVVTFSPSVVTLNIVTTFTGTASTANVHGVIYTTTTTGDILTLYSGLSAAPSAGSVTVVAAGIYAIRLY